MMEGGYSKYMKHEIRSKLFYRDVIVEILATFILMSFQCVLPLTWGKGTAPNAFGNIVQVGLGMGFMVCATAWTFGDFGGCHMNPAVTVGMAVSMRITALRAIFYIVAQCIGALLGAGFILGLTPSARRESLAATTLNPELESWQGMLIEVWLTFFLVSTILAATNEQRKGNVYMPTIVIGFAVAVGVMSGAAQTGASMNPARSLGPAVAMGIWDDHWIYWVGPLLGGTIAALVYKLIEYVDHTPERSKSKVSDLGVAVIEDITAKTEF